MRACVNFSWLPDGAYQYYFKDPVHILETESQHELIRQAEAWSQTHYVLLALNYESQSGGKAYIFNTPVTEEEFGEKEKLKHSLSFSFVETKEEIMTKVQQIQDEIRQGNTYQVNYTTRLTAKSDESSYAVYCKLTEEMNGRYTMYIEDDDYSIISISPELFFQYDCRTNEITTQPMKGTLPRGNSVEEDDDNYELLSHSKKDQAENVMIVDLLRNDLSRIAEKNSVHVEKLFEIIKYPTVFQMVSTIKAVVKQDLPSIIQALFPCGSITGAPKLSTMEIIKRLEVSSRGIYCGALGLLTANRMIFNVPIRTIEKKAETWTYGVGGGITIDSEPEKEFEEMVAKASILDHLTPSQTKDFHLIETMKVNKEGIARLSEHKARLKSSLNYFKLRYNADALERVFNTTSNQEAMLRLTVYDGYMSCTLKEISPLQTTKVAFKQMKEKDLVFLQHKTSKRAHYYTEPGFLSLYYNEETFLTEFNVGNLVYRIDGVYYTPDVQGQLPGCMQALLLKQGILKRRNISINEILSDEIDGVWMINSLREWVPVELPATMNGNSFEESVK